MRSARADWVSAAACTARLWSASEQHRELLAAKAGDDVAASRGAGDGVGDQDDGCCGGGVAEAVVDVLEVVDVKEDHRQLRAEAHRTADVAGDDCVDRAG